MSEKIIQISVPDGELQACRHELSETKSALEHARDQFDYWSWRARWRGGGPEYRAHCQKQAAFFGGWIPRLERARDHLLGHITACNGPVVRYLN